MTTLNAQYTASKAGAAWSPVRLATAAALPANTYASATKTKTADANGALGNIDSVAAVVGDRVLDKDAGTASERGIFRIVSLGSAGSKWSMIRDDDADESADFVDGKLVGVGVGTANADTTWQLTTSGAFTLDTSSVTFSKPSLAVANATATNQATAIRDQQSLGALAAAGADYHAAYAGGAGAIDDAVGPFARLVPPRTVQVKQSAGCAAGNATIDGTDPDGATLQEVLACAGGGETKQGARAFTTISRLRYSADPGGGESVTFEAGVGFGLGVVCSAIDAVGVDGVLEAPTSSHAATGTVVPATAPDGAKVFAVDYRVQHNHTQDAHNHSLT